MSEITKYNFVFFGTPEFAAIILDKLINAGFIPQAVICNPDQPVGRKKIITPPPVKAKIMNYKLRIKNQIEILQPEKLDKTFHDSLFLLHNSSFDFFIVAAYGKIIPKEILEIPHLGTIGIHPSLLPKLRGPSPIQTTILNAKEKTGVTLFLLDEKIDHGPIISQRQLENQELRITPVEYLQSKNSTGQVNYEELNTKLADLGADLLIETLPKWLKGEIKPIEQNEAEASYTKMIRKEDGEINLQKETAEEIDRKIRALNPEPGTYIRITNNELRIKNVKILRANLVSIDDNDDKISPSRRKIGNFLIQNQRLYLKTKKGVLEIEILQPEGRNPINAKDFINGYLRRNQSGF